MVLRNINFDLKMMMSGGSVMDMRRSTEILGLQILRSPEEGGVKKEYDYFVVCTK